MVKHVEKSFMDISIDYEHEFVYLEWKGDLKDDYFIQGVEASIKACFDNKFQKLIYNDLKIGTINNSAKIKVLTEIAPEAYKQFRSKNLYFALIQSSILISKVTSKIMMRALSVVLPALKLETFDTAEKAFEWIKKCNK